MSDLSKALWTGALQQQQVPLQYGITRLHEPEVLLRIVLGVVISASVLGSC